MTSGTDAKVSAVAAWLLPCRRIRVQLPRVAARMRKRQIWELLLERHVVDVDAVAERRLHAPEHTHGGLQRDVHHVVSQPPPVRETSGIAGQNAKTSRIGRRQDV